MEKLTLKHVLKRKEVREGIKSNLLKGAYVEAIDKVLNSKEENSISIIVDLDGIECDFENTLYIDEVKNCYLLESRLFNRKNDTMINSYLELLNNDGSIMDVCIDDVWDYADWKAVE